MIDKKKHSIDDLVHYVTLHKVYPLALSGTVWPFVVLYFLCLGFIFQSEEEDYEYGFIALAVIAVKHIVTCLCCYWSVHVSAFLNCRRVNKLFIFIIFHSSNSVRFFFIVF